LSSHGGAATLSTERCGDAVKKGPFCQRLLADGRETAAAVATPRGLAWARRFGRASSPSLNRTRSDDALGARVRCSSRSAQPFGTVWTAPEWCPRADRKRQRSDARVTGSLSRRRRGSSRTWRSSPRHKPHRGRVAARTDRSKLANANTVAIRSQPSERELCWLHAAETQFVVNDAPVSGPGSR